MNCLKCNKIKNLIKSALNEDIGKCDITTKLIIPQNIKIKAVIIAKEKGIACGMDIAGLVFKSLDPQIRYFPLIKDGGEIKKGAILAKISGRAAGILTAERVALNFLGLLCGIATRTKEFVRRTKPYHVKILDTRKTIPQLRLLEKYAVKTAGGNNHRESLDKMILIKDNHLRIRKNFSYPNKEDMISLVNGLRKKIPKGMQIEVETSSLKEFKTALAAYPDIIMLDNMNTENIKKAVCLRNSLPKNRKDRLPKLEASGNIILKNISRYAASGIDFISLGTLTKDIHALDLSLEFKNIF